MRGFLTRSTLNITGYYILQFYTSHKIKTNSSFKTQTKLWKLDFYINLQKYSITILYCSVSKESTCNTGDTRDRFSLPRLGRSPGGGHGNLLQYSCLENPVDRGAWWTTVQRVAKSQTRLTDCTLSPTPLPTHCTSETKAIMQINYVSI